jgi:hypothetical protein
MYPFKGGLIVEVGILRAPEQTPKSLRKCCPISGGGLFHLLWEETLMLPIVVI